MTIVTDIRMHSWDSLVSGPPVAKPECKPGVPQMLPTFTLSGLNPLELP